MLGIIVLFIISWLLIWFIQKEHITVLGIIPNAQGLKEFFLGITLMAVLCAINLLGQSYLKEIDYTLNPNYGLKDGLNGIYWSAKSALFEELIFRGVLLYILIKKTSIPIACILSAVVFGIYHWFSYGMFGSGIIPMIYVFLITGAGGWMFAYAFAKTKSLYAPFGLHLGWILVSIVIFSEGPLGYQLLIPTGEGKELGAWATLVFFIWQAVLTPGIVSSYLARKF